MLSRAASGVRTRDLWLGKLSYNTASSWRLAFYRLWDYRVPQTGPFQPKILLLFSGFMGIFAKTETKKTPKNYEVLYRS